MPEPRVLYTEDGDPVELQLIDERNDCDFIGEIVEGLLGYESPIGEQYIIALVATTVDDDSDDGDTITSKELVHGSHETGRKRDPSEYDESNIERLTTNAFDSLDAMSDE